GVARPGEGVRDLRRDRRRRRVIRAAARRGAHRGALVALVPVREPRDRRAHGAGGPAPARGSGPRGARSHRRPRRATTSPGLFALVFGFSRAETTSWSDPLTIAALGLSVGLLSAFLAFEG